MVWGYAKENGPQTWSIQFPIAAGPKQSPIDIECGKASSDPSLKPVVSTYKDIKVSELSNSGHSWKAQIVGGVSLLKDGPLGTDEYVLEQFHTHWGKTDATGSEHTIDGQKYAAELHLVHWNKTKFKSFGEAAAADGGLAVLGIFLKSGAEHKELTKITKLLPFIQYKGQAISITEGIDPSLFLPAERNYFTYSGSLTTPPCYESVSWIVFQNPIEVSEKQLLSFRNMKSFHPCEKCPQDELAGCLVENYRPPCPLNDRVVRSFKTNPKEE